jgi:hypothetical protein
MDETKEETHIDNLLSLLGAKSEEDKSMENLPYAGRGNVNPPSVDPTKKAPTTIDLIKKSVDVLGGTDPSELGGVLGDPRGAGAITGAGIGAYQSGASFNPFKPYFLQNNPRYNGVTPPPRSTFNFEGASSPSSPVYETATGKASMAGRTGAENMFTNQVANQSFANAPKGRIESFQSSGIKGPSLNQLHAEMGPTEVKMIGGRPMEIPLGSANPLPTTETPPSSITGRTVGALENAFPGAKTVVQWAKGALPTISAIGKGAGVGASLADIGSRAMQGDYPGMGISGIGAAGMLAAPEIGIPLSLGSLAINYLRDNPELKKQFLENIMHKVGSKTEQLPYKP